MVSEAMAVETALVALLKTVFPDKVYRLGDMTVNPNDLKQAVFVSCESEKQPGPDHFTVRASIYLRTHNGSDPVRTLLDAMAGTLDTLFSGRESLTVSGMETALLPLYGGSYTLSDPCHQQAFTLEIFCRLN